MELVLRIIAAIILLQTLFFKFSAAPESVYIFQTVNAEPWGRIMSGILEAIAGVALLTPRYAFWGAMLGAAVMTGALGAHFTVLGIDVMGDRGVLFSLAVVAWASCLGVMGLRWKAGKAFVALALLFGTTCPSVGATVAPNEKNGVAIHGYDPVAYLDKGNAEPGKAEFTHTFKGATYRFANAESLEKFKKEPEKYEPIYAGWCAYAMAEGELVDIDPKTFKIVEGKTHLFYNGFWGNTLKKWNSNEISLKMRADKAWRQMNRLP